MLISLHTACVMYTDLVTDLRIARMAGYDGVELWIPKVIRYLDAGHGADQLAESLDGLRVTMLDVLLPIERRDPDFRRDLLDRCARMAALAARLGCPALQVVALDQFKGVGWPAVRA